MSLMIKNGRLLTKDGNFQICDIYIENGKIHEINEILYKKADEVIDAEGLFVSPGFIDLHVHLREPGGEKKRPLKREHWLRLKGDLQP